ncbi:type IV secretory system conjugative DNA transfer family protein [Candidatus Parcubacteria bacterium]|nr:type IV secretory system conjugative DNA transfer family protein [Candidatus Parcubacteria bacterium]
MQEKKVEQLDNENTGMHTSESSKGGKTFASLEEELEYLRGEVRKNQEKNSEQFEQDQIITQEIKTYHQETGRDLLHESYIQPENKNAEIVLNLAPENHDKNMEEYWTLMNKNGIYNTLNILKNTGNPHLEDDFHRFLVEYIKAGLTVPNLKESDPVDRSIRQTLYQVSLPDFKEKDGAQKPLKELLSVMEQFYLGMTSIAEAGKKFADSKNSMTIELSIAEGSEEFIFYVSVPNEKKDLFEKHILSVFPGAKIEIEHNDYNIFDEDGISLGSVASFVKDDIYPIKTYEEFDADPINVILNAFSKIQKSGEGACIQVVFNNVGDYYHKLFRNALDNVLKGESLKKTTDIRHTVWGQFSKVAAEIGKEMVDGALSHETKKDEASKEKYIDQIAVEQIKHKIASPIIETNIRLLASSKDRMRTENILSDLESSFNQFTNALGNSFKWKRVKDSELKELFYKFTFRLFDRDHILPVSIKEITTVMHFPMMTQSNFSPQLKQTTAATAPAPLDIPRKDEGVFLGKNVHRNVEQDVYMTPEDRLRHMYVIGQTGTGKSTILRNLIVQDIINGDGVCFIDPHGNDVQDILSKIPKERYDDVIYFDPGYTDRPMALNMLEYDHANPEQKTFVVNELFSIFQKLYGANPESMGPMFEQYFRNATMLVMDDPDSGCTLLDISRVMAVKSFRDMKIAHCKNPIVKQFWTEIAEKTSGESGLANMIPYITSKFDVFAANEIMRPIIAQEHSSFNFREIMDSKKILLVNLSKGRLGDINSNLIGLIIVGKILMAALSRVDSFGKDMNPFYLYIDEFQNITTPSISTILSEARKYKLSLTVAHQFISQLDDKIKASVFGNVGNMVVYRTGAEDAEFLQKQFEPVFQAKDIMNIDNLNAYIKMLSHGKPTKPFNIRVDHTPRGNMDVVESLKELSYLKYGKDKDMITEEVDAKFASDKPKPKPAPDLSAFGL